jgi:hypothetical protein
MILSDQKNNLCELAEENTAEITGNRRALSPSRHHLEFKSWLDGKWMQDP